MIEELKEYAMCELNICTFNREDFYILDRNGTIIYISKNSLVRNKSCGDHIGKNVKGMYSYIKLIDIDHYKMDILNELKIDEDKYPECFI